MSSIHQFSVAGIKQEEIDFADIKGKNIGGKCRLASGCTAQYQQLHKRS